MAEGLERQKKQGHSVYTRYAHTEPWQGFALASLKSKPKMKTKRTSIVNLRLSAEEKALWQHQAADAGLTLADFLRKKTDGAESTNIEPRKKRRPFKQIDADQELLRGIARLNSNLNQIAKWANTFKDAVDAASVISELIIIDENISNYLPPKLLN